MIKGIYTSASAMVPRLKKQELVANNLANASTPGYKKDRLFVQELTKAEKRLRPQKSDWQEPMVDQIYTSFAPGAFDRTGNPLNLAIDGDGFFQVELADGSRALTRNGAFSVSADGLLEIPGGATLIGEGGAIEVGSGKVEISATGIVTSDGQNVGRITPVTVENFDTLHKVGGSLFVVPEGTELIPIETSNIQQGFLEASNVDIVKEMIEMIISFRNYEADSKAIKTQDDSLEQLFNRVGSSR